jgi:hypothetical protein
MSPALPPTNSTLSAPGRLAVADHHVHAVGAVEIAIACAGVDDVLAVAAEQGVLPLLVEASSVSPALLVK